MPEEPNEEGEKVGRGNFMKMTIAGIGGLIGIVYAIPSIAYVLGPALQKATSEWIPLGSVSKVETGVPTLFKTTLQTQTGWISNEEEFSAYVLTEDGQSYIVMSNICTHLGCRVRWIDEKGNFYCPCHNGVFARNGTVVSGPPPRPLDRYENKVENGVLYVKRG
jgi:quinol---cytochrome c reductase iron-sulfur subunit, bacillus type